MCIKAENKYQQLQDQIDRLVEYKGLIQSLIDEKRMALEIYRGIVNKEFQVFFQPKVDVKSLELVGAEALIRWQHPEKGYIAPDHFIPWCESSGMIELVDELVFEEVCKCIKKLIKQDEKKVPIGVNVSRVTLMNPRFPTRCREILTEYEIEAQQIEIEVTESALVEHEHAVIASIKQLKALG
ncbi:MAG: EAL domain-containing protein, partial [Cellulosilyticaceae bacterium]